MQETLSGIINSIIFRNDANGWTVMEISTNETGDTHTVVGCLPALAPGESVEIEGQFVEHPSYGLQFKATAARALAPATLGALQSYLGSGMIKGVGETMARRIVAHFGMETLSVLEREPERLKEISGIGRAKAAQIATSFFEQRAMRDTMLGLQAFGITVGQAVKLYQRYGDSSLARISENPYQLIEDIEGFGFKTADAIALHAGFEHDSRERLRAGLRYALQWARQDGGHTYLPRAHLLTVASGLLGTEPAALEDALDSMIIDGGLIYTMLDKHDAVFLPVLHYVEKEVARRLHALAVRPLDAPVLDLDGEVEQQERAEGISLAPPQREAVLTALREGLMVITGGPGTGKTTILRFIIRVLERLGMDYALCAPTGRAAKRMEEATGGEAKTIHRLLEYGGGEEDGTFAKNEEDPLFFDMVVVDEMSMVDVSLMHALLRALPSGTRLVLVGDSDQLPPVGAGNVLHDVIASGAAPVIRLTDIFRQSERGGIATNARLINLGRAPIPADESEFSFEENTSAERVIARVLALCGPGAQALGAREPMMDIQVLAPMKKGPLGVKNLNVRLQEALNPPAYTKPQKEFGDTIFRLGDKVMQIKNNYRIEWGRERAGKLIEQGHGVYNGDLGTICRLDPDEGTLTIVFDDGRTAEYGFSQLSELDLAYCISIHKSQGSEFPIVLLPLLSGPSLLMTRNLLYTGVTRARHRVHIIGRWETLLQMAQNQQTKRRYSALGVWLSAARDK